VLNALVDSDRAIVTPIAGTTRDFVESDLQINGVRVTVVDTAGLRVTDDQVEKIGVERALARLSEADLILYLVDGSVGLTDEDRTFFSKIPWERAVLVVNKSDLPSTVTWDEESHPPIYVSALGQPGVESIRDLIASRIGADLAEDSTVISQARHFQGLNLLLQSLLTALPLIQQGESADLIALELQSGLQAIYEILGLTFDDQVMDRVFSEFCLGK
jgi:tRNA modification GTPase